VTTDNPSSLAGGDVAAVPRPPDLATISIDRRRLWDSLMELKEIGAYDDDATGLRGVRRLALTDEDAAARRRCVKWMLEAGLDVRVDKIGNVYASRTGSDPSLPCVLMGSHIDTVAPAARSTARSACSAASR
jgi:N-carbamoyl-L-amino-acid hydrolase